MSEAAELPCHEAAGSTGGFRENGARLQVADEDNPVRCDIPGFVESEKFR